MKRTGWLVALLLSGCTTQTVAVSKPPAAAPKGEKRTLTLPVSGPRDIFLLKADGTPFRDARNRYKGEIAVEPYRSRLDLAAVSVGTATGKRSSLVAELPFADSTHNISDDRPTVFLEVDGRPLRDGEDFDSVIQSIDRGKTHTVRVNFTLLEPGLKRIEQAQQSVAVKIRLRSDIFAAAGECERAIPGSAAAEDCRKPYTGRTIEAKNLGLIKAFLAAKNS